MTIINNTKKRQQSNGVDLKCRLSCSIDINIIYLVFLSLSLSSKLIYFEVRRTKIHSGRMSMQSRLAYLSGCCDVMVLSIYLKFEGHF
ncbi:MAG: hypothetical protein ACI8RD_012862 [Bacillariaceae sp.]|jgi:hypothetical protein